VVELTAHGADEPTLRQARGATPGAAGAQPAAAVSPDGGTLYAALGGGVVAIDTAALSARAHGLDGRQVTGLATSPDGTTVYAIEGSTRLLVVDARSLAVARDVPMGGKVEAIQRAT
jgi:DNA-binding beta-propeller fold protein YncE